MHYTYPHEQPVRVDRCNAQGQFFKTEFNRFEFRVFLFLDQLPYHSLSTQSGQLFTYC